MATALATLLLVAALAPGPSWLPQPEVQLFLAPGFRLEVEEPPRFHVALGEELANGSARYQAAWKALLGFEGQFMLRRVSLLLEVQAPTVVSPLAAPQVGLCPLSVAVIIGPHIAESWCEGPHLPPTGNYRIDSSPPESPTVWARAGDMVQVVVTIESSSSSELPTLFIAGGQGASSFIEFTFTSPAGDSPRLGVQREASAPALGIVLAVALLVTVASRRRNG